MGRMGSGHGPLAVRRGGLILSETIHVLNAIGDAWREAQDGRRLNDVGPSDGAVIATIPRSSSLDVEDAVCAAESAQAAWGARSIEERAEMLDAIADAMEGTDAWLVSDEVYGPMVHDSRPAPLPSLSLIHI